MPPDTVPPTDASRPPADSPVLSFLRRVHDRHRLDDTGTVATYIPELAGADPASFGIVVATVDGAVYEIGDTRTPFTIQSMAKPLTYAAILDRLGRPRSAGGSASSRPATRSTPSPSAPARACRSTRWSTPARSPPWASCRTGRGGARARRRRASTLVASLGRFAGRELDLDEAVYVSERDTGHRNRAIAHLLRGTGAITDDPDAVVDAYFKVCAVSITARDLALVAATLANGGRHPLTGEQAASDATVRDTLSVMATCGMYDGAGEWLYEVGLPAKSGVSGGIFAVLPGQLGIGVWSPRLDSRGNSVRGVAVCRDLARELDLHLVRGARPPSAVRTRASVAALPSKRARGAHERERISVDGDRSLVIELQGSLGFVAVETLAREALPADGAADAVVVDLRRVQRIDPSVAGLLADLVAALGGRGAAVAWSGANPHAESLARVDDALAELRMSPPRRFAELDLALEWAEDVVLSRFGGRPSRPGLRASRPARGAPGLRGPERHRHRLPAARHGTPPVPVRGCARPPRRARRGAVRDHRWAAVGVGAGRRPGHEAPRHPRGRPARGRARVPRPRAPHRRRLLRLGGRGLRPHDRGVRRARRDRSDHHDRVPHDAAADGPGSPAG